MGAFIVEGSGQLRETLLVPAKGGFILPREAD